LMLDKSGYGNHASQATSASRPVYRTDGTLHWLEFDGVDDFFITSIASVVGTYAAGAEILSTDSAVAAKTGDSISYFSGTTGGTLYCLLDANNSATWAVTTFSAPRKFVQFSYANQGLANSWIDGNEFSTQPTAAITDSPSLHLIGVRDDAGVKSWYLDGRIYGLLLLDRRASSSERVNSEQYLAQKSGVTL